MDQQKKHRKVLRAAFTKSANELDKLLSEETALQQVQVAWEVLLQKPENLLIANREIYDTLLQEDVSEEDLMVEIDSCEGYDKKFIDLRITYGNHQKHIDIGLDEDDRRSRASLAFIRPVAVGIEISFDTGLFAFLCRLSSEFKPKPSAAKEIRSSFSTSDFTKLIRLSRRLIVDDSGFAPPLFSDCAPGTKK
ncbi:hypothetical protein JTB14_014907 [Gonioctena quinquepunctata]|nr:hypothetical protein JTB14_014907 [Gonioctena quinquepunctata]